MAKHLIAIIGNILRMEQGAITESRTKASPKESPKESRSSLKGLLRLVTFPLENNSLFLCEQGLILDFLELYCRLFTHSRNTECETLC